MLERALNKRSSSRRTHLKEWARQSQNVRYAQQDKCVVYIALNWIQWGHFKKHNEIGSFRVYIASFAVWLVTIEGELSSIFARDIMCHSSVFRMIWQPMAYQRQCILLPIQWGHKGSELLLLPVVAGELVQASGIAIEYIHFMWSVQKDCANKQQ